ncbi:redoxin domain-containing protein [Halorubellus sp. JP-L1]|uniref:redoxin domain-containing protein n=1 Tax=Halorubellus sp. JP-L1 TaxID=2715753 RepID=UPI00140B2A98|nr:redoxin domain-containing protein [Halorubellus sp. JP-L1]
MLTVGNDAPEFALPGVTEGTTDTYSLQESTDDGRAVLLLFYPFDFSPVCTTELCTIRDAEWFEFTPGLDVWAVSGDSTHSHTAFADAHDLNFPLLSDYDASVADAFGVRYDEHQGHRGVPKRAVFVVDPDRTVRYAWSTDDAFERPDFFHVTAAVDELEAIDDSLVPDDADLDVMDVDPTT